MKTIETVFGAIAQHAKNFPDKKAIIAGKESINYQNLADKVSAIALSLHAHGIMPGDRVGVNTGNVMVHLIGSLGTMAAGAIPIALPNTDYISYNSIIEDALPSMIIGVGAFDLCDSFDIPIYHQIDELIENNVIFSNAILERSVDPEEIAMIYYTSGTSSGVRKGVMQSYRALHNTAEYIVNITQLSNEVCEFVASSIDNAFWFGRCRCILKVGGTILLHDGTLNPLSIINSIKKNKGNAISGDTPVFLLLIKFLEKNLRQISSEIRWVKIASQAMSLKDKERIINLLPNARIVMGYGLTEAMRTSLLPFSDFPNKLSSDGQPCPGVSIAIADRNGEFIVRPNEMGEVLISGGNIASGYWNKDRMWKEKLNGKWYKSGDLGYLDECGFLFLLGRIDQAINSGGKTIALGEVESRLRPHILTTNFVVCGMSDPREILGEIIVICIEGVWNEEYNWKDLRVHLFEHMESSFVPKEAYLIPLFPRTSNGKIQLGILREKLEQGTFEKC